MPKSMRTAFAFYYPACSARAPVENVNVTCPGEDGVRDAAGQEGQGTWSVTARGMGWGIGSIRQSRAASG
jgi:hypothetical protein